MLSYFCLFSGDMYQSKSSLRPSGEAGGEWREEEEVEEGPPWRSAEAAVMRWAFEEGTSHCGSVSGTS